MPDFVTHSIYATSTMELFKNKYNIDLSNFRKTIILGGQGPDPFFYYNFYKKDKSLSKIGNHIHSNNTQEFFIHYINKMKENNNDLESFAHLFGMICHYFLDQYCHPYIFYKTGVYNKSDKSTYHFRGLHVKFEKAIDALFIKDHYKKNPNTYKIYQEIIGNQDLNPNIIQNLNHVLSKTFSYDHAGDVYQTSVKHMKLFFKYIIFDRFGIKKLLFKLLGFFNKTGSNVFEYFSIHNIVEKNIDYLNSSKSEWLHPVDSSIKSNESFTELFNESQEKCIEVLYKVYQYIYLNTPIDLSTIIPDVSYSTGLDWKDDRPMVNFNSIYKKTME